MKGKNSIKINPDMKEDTMCRSGCIWKRFSRDSRYNFTTKSKI